MGFPILERSARPPLPPPHGTPVEPSEHALSCFAHGLAHVIDELGEDEALAWISRAVVSLYDDRDRPDR